MREREANHRYNQATTTAWFSVQQQFSYILEDLDEWQGKAVTDPKKSELRDPKAPSEFRITWVQFAQRVNSAVNAVRFPSDPDRK